MRLTDPDWQYIEERTRDFTGRDWVFERVRSFLASEARMLVIVASPGAGKTAIAARLAQASAGRLKDDKAPPVPVGTIDAAIFCRAGRVNLLEVAQDLGSQLSAALESFSVEQQSALATQVTVSDVHVQTGAVTGGSVSGVNIDLGRLGPEGAFDEGVSLPLRRLSEKQDFPPPVLLVDSLDEAYATPRARSLPGLLADLAGVRLILTTRDDRRVLAELGDLKGAVDSGQAVVVNLLDDAPSGVDDVGDYVHSRLRGRAPNDAVEILAGRIAAAAAGNFLYARVVVGRFGDSSSVGPLDAAAARELPLPTDGLRGAYRDFLAREISGDEERWRKLLRPILAPLAVALGDGFDTTQLAAIGGAFRDDRMSRTDARDVTRSLAQFLDGTHPDGPFRVYHQSFAEFLLDEQRNPDWAVDPSQAHAAIVAGLLPDGAPLGAVEGSWDIVDWSVVDRYGLLYLATHLASVDAVGLARLLTSYPYLESKVAGAGLGFLLQDFDYATQALKGLDWRRIIKLLRGALRLAGQAIVRNPAELPTQLVGRLGGLTEEPIRSLVAAARRSRAKPWLEPLTPSLAPPGGVVRATLRGHEGTPRSVAISWDGRIGASAGNSTPDQTVRVWDLDDGDELFILRNQAAAGGYTPLAISGDNTLLLTAYEREVRLWDLATGESLATLAGHSALVEAVAISSRSLAASADIEGAVLIWDLDSRKLVRALRDGPGGVRSMALNPDGGRLAILADEALELWDVGAARRVARRSIDPIARSGWSFPIAVSWDASLVAFLGQRWTVVSDDLRSVQSGDAGRPLAITLDGLRTLATGASDLGCDLWEFDGHRLRILPDRDARTASGAISPDGRWALTAYYDHRVVAWDFDVPADDGPTSTSEPIQRVAIDVDGRHAMAFTESGAAIWNVDTGETVTGSPAGDAALEATRINLDAEATTVARLEAERSAAQVRDDDGPGSNEADGTGSPKGDAVFVAPMEARHVWAVDPSGRLALRWLRPMAKSSEAEEPADIDSARYRYEVDVVAVDPYQTVARLNGHSMPIWAGAISTNGLRAVTGSVGRLVRVWNLPGGGLRATLPPHRDPVSAVGLSGDGTLVVSASWDGSVRLWDVDGGRTMATFSGDSPMTSCAISADASTVVAGDRAGRVHLLRLQGARD